VGERANLNSEAPAEAEATAELLATLSALEAELHHAGHGCPGGRLEQLLHPQFHEVGRSGRLYTRAEVLAFLAAQTSVPDVQSDGHRAEQLAEGLVLLTYRSAQRRSGGELELHTHRASLWQRMPGGWQMRYHQGTPAAQAW
jgi:hypothetical protein